MPLEKTEVKREPAKVRAIVASSAPVQPREPKSPPVQAKG
jgi:hypothetical protein